MTTTGQVRVALATPLDEDLCAYIEGAEPQIQLIRDQSLLPPMRWAADHGGDPAFARSPEQEAAFENLLSSAEVWYGIPGESPAALAAALRRSPRLRWVQTMAAGGGGQVRSAHLTSEELARVTFTTSAGVHGSPLAEFAVFGVLAGAKSLPRLLDQKQRKEWSGRWCMQQIDEMTVVVAGLGGIGRQIATRLRALGATVIGAGREGAEVPEVSEVVGLDDLASVFSSADALVLALPGTAFTQDLISAQVLEGAKPGLIVVNVGRGTVIDERALIAALDSGHVGFAALDVFAEEPLAQESPLWEHPNVLVSPHTAALNASEDRRIAELFVENCRRYLAGDPLLNVVNVVEFY